MIDSRILDVDPVLGETEIFHYDDTDGSFTIETVTDFTGLAEYNQAQYNSKEKHSRYGDMDRVASAPMVVYHELKQKGILDDKKALRRWLNDPDNRVFRTRPGRI